jgi:LmbE family N-acetylglucosaminyl deacetylase
MRRLLLALAALAACGDGPLPDGEPLRPAPDLTIVAHQDDDLIFMQPDIAELAARHTGLTNVYVTAGNGRRGRVVAERRYRGLMEAYAAAAGVESRWSCGWIAIAGHAAEHCRLGDAAISLVFLGYPDGGKEGEEDQSLLHLWSGTISDAGTVARRSARYDRDGLIATVAEAITATAPTTIRTLEIAATHGRDHADHMIVGALATLAAARAGYAHALLWFRGYGIVEEPETNAGARFDRAFVMLARYHACASRCASCGEACDTFNEAHQNWVRRRYAVGRRTAPVSGRLRLGGRCTVLDASGALTLGDCAAAPAWRFEASGALRAADRCLGARPTGELIADAAGSAATACPSDGAHRFLLDDEGHIWVGLPPAPATVKFGVHATCIDERARASACGEGHAPSWELLAHEMVEVPRADGPARSERDARSIEPGRSPAEPTARWTGDLDGDGAPDWCTGSPSGVRCGLAAERARSPDGAPWSFIQGGVPAAFPAAPALGALGDIDGDHLADLCTVQERRILCTRSNRYGFGPAVPIAELPPGPPPRTLWFHDASVCVDDGAAIRCTRPSI